MKVSIITACYNAEKTIEDTIRSVLKQSYDDIEYIIVDGASTDNTLSLINNHKNSISTIISEKDSGVYNAMNKGIKASSGDLLYFLNADDVLINENVIKQFAEFAKNTKAGLVLGDLIALDRNDGRVFKVTQDYVDKARLINAFLCHPAMFFRRELFDKYGSYNENYKVVSDYEWYVNYFTRQGGDFAYLNKPVAIFDMSGISSDENNKQKHQAERDKVEAEYFSAFDLQFFKAMNKIFPRRINKLKFRKRVPFNQFYKRINND